MAESKASISSKGGANVLAKRVQKQFSRAQEKVLQRLGKSEETKDEHFEQCVINLQCQQNDGYRIYKDLKAYLNAVTVMRDASGRLFQSLFDAYDEKWDGAEDLGVVVEGEDLLWKDYEDKLRDQALITMESYMSQFPDVREKVAKRNRKLVDYDSSRHHLTGLQNAKKKDDIKIGKAEDEMNAAKVIFEDMNRELKMELPLLFDSRIGCFVTVFQAICNLRDIFYKELTKNNEVLQTVMKELSTQYPDKSFVVKNFNRAGSLKRRSFRDTLSPRSLKSFYDFHSSYNPRGSLRRDNSSSFRSDRLTYGSYSPKQTSPTSPQPLYDNVSGAKDAKGSPTRLDYRTEEGTSPREPQLDNTSSSEDKLMEENKKAKKKESSQASDQETLNEQESSEEESGKSELKANSNITESSKIKDQKSPEKVGDGEPSGVENGIPHDIKSDVEQAEPSNNALTKGDHQSGEVKEEATTEAPK
ncbi:bridging integrator 2a [Onychostoma macrolepis]|uniref:bridging integrator 2a n=1 Tax=Onychostoma macrolepis TaxID=369639 RepID=UPI00272A0766|nr:bridging integrator 2a [Onychostoma macrolepis]XP_058619820.1 bridging integrator 2a [Onychostoma macrolepis]XP_058619821.1 bridging integrator 2a [Onychostoma macrolepis]XP_058619822.1 bridging integrator 2a [Onychostoma macrolepis]